MKGLLHIRSLQLLLCLLFSTAFSAFAQNNTIFCPVFQEDYSTGSCNATIKTQTSLVKAYCQNGERGWAKFDISNVPDSINIISVKLHYFIYNQNYPYYLITKLNANPVTTAAPNLYSVIGQATASNTNPNTYLIYNGQAVNGWNIMTLNSYAKNDLLNALSQNWFSVGFYEYESSGGYFLETHGWNEQNKPYLEINYTPLNFNNDLAISAITSPVENSCEDTIPLQAIIYNNGTNAITSSNLNITRYNVNIGNYAYTSPGLLPGQYDTVNLGNYVFPYGYNQVAVSVSTVNNYTDPNFVNNSQVRYFSVLEPASITLQPQNQSVLTGANIIFSTEISAYYYQSFQWQISTDGGQTFTDLVNG